MLARSPTWLLGACLLFACAEGSGDDGGGSNAGALPDGDPYDHVVPADVGVTIGTGSIADPPTAMYDGPTEITQPTVIENVIIDGCLDVLADDVVLRNVVINCDGLYPVKASGDTSGLLVEHSEIACGSTSKVFFITDHADATIRNNELRGCEDFFFIGGEVGELRVENNDMHSLNLSPESHADGFQIGEAQRTTGTIIIAGNYIDPHADGGKTDVVFATNETAADLVIHNNYFHVWGLRTIRCVTSEVTCDVSYNVFDWAFEQVETSGGKRVFLQSHEDMAEPTFACNVYPDGELVEEHDVVDRVWGTDHVVDDCPAFPG